MLIRPIWPAWYSLNQSSPLRTTSESGRQPGVRPFENSVTAPSGVMRPMRLTLPSENQMFPSGPATMPSGPASAVGTGNSVTAPDVVIRPTLLPAFSQNHSVPSVAGAIPIGRLFRVGVSNSMKLPLPGFILQILDVPLSQNQRCWSGPNTMMYGLLCGVGTQNRVLLLLPNFLGAADIFDRPLLCKRIVGSQHHVARWDLGYQEFQHVRIEQHGVEEEARQVAAEVAFELRGAAIAIIVVVPPGVERQISAAVGDHDFQLGKLVHDPLIDQRRQCVGLFQGLPDRNHQSIAKHTFVGISRRVDEDHGAELFRLGPERP